MPSLPYDSLLLVSFGGPEGPDQVVPFLENVTRGRNVPRARLLQVAEHYDQFGGISPINAQNRALIAALTARLADAGPELPTYFGNRNWHPLLDDTLREMTAAGCRRSLAFVTSAFSCYSGCRQYLEDIERARAAVGPDAPRVDKLRVFYNHPGFIEPMVESLQAAIDQIPSERRAAAEIAFTAHSIPQVMADQCRYVVQLEEASRLVAGGAGRRNWRLVYQSRSGPPSQPWLGPDVLDHLRELREQGVADVVVVPIGFISDHMEVLYDLETEAADLCRQLGLNMIRARTVGNHPRFVEMIRELIIERMGERVERRALGCFGPAPDFCAANCCPLGAKAG